ncbi:MAG: HAD-IIB family hydrolase [Methylococcales bacterium]
MSRKILLCTDLDRTLLPNGPQPESVDAPQRFAVLAARPEVTIAYVTGRHRALVQQAIDDYMLPIPDYVVADVGTSIYEITDAQWQSWNNWGKEIAPDWAGLNHDQIHQLFTDISELTLQEPSKQSVYKLSYYVPLDVDSSQLINEMQTHLDKQGVSASLVWSVDELAEVGLLDVLPERATKLHAIQFLMQQNNFSLTDTVFAGDSGNDLQVLTSSVHSVLVANASSEVREQAQEQAAAGNTTDALYIATGNFHEMNGHYSAGILEGLAHFIPETENWW